MPQTLMTPKPLFTLFAELHQEMISQPYWTMPDPRVHYVQWRPWKCWGPSGYTEQKLKMMWNWYFPQKEIDRVGSLLERAFHSTGRFSAVTFGIDQAKDSGSPLRYKMGACLASIVFKTDAEQRSVCPTIVWRTSEITRRSLADYVLLTRLFSIVSPFQVRKAHLIFNTLFLADFHLPVVARWFPGIEDQDRFRRRKLYEVGDVEPKYKSRQIGWNVARKSTAMYNRRNDGTWRLRNDHSEGDWP